MTSLEEIARMMRVRVASYVPITIPLSITKLGVSILESASRLIGVRPIVSAVQLDYLTKGWEPSSYKAIRELSWKPMVLAEGMDRYLSARSGAGECAPAFGSTTRAGEATGSNNQTRHLPLKTIARLQLATAASLLVYWLLFFTVGLAPANPPAGYFVFQHSFTVPDIFLALALIRAATWLLSEDSVQRSRGRALSLVCCGALFFLGMLDISFNILNSVYAVLSLETVIEMAVNAWCIGFAVAAGLKCARNA